MDDSDILERNDELNRKVSGLTETYTRRKVVDSLLVVIIVLVVAAISTIVWINFSIENNIENSSTQETQLICEHLLKENQEHHYIVCDEVGRPEQGGDR